MTAIVHPFMRAFARTVERTCGLIKQESLFSLISFKMAAVRHIGFFKSKIAFLFVITSCTSLPNSIQTPQAVGAMLVLCIDFPSGTCPPFWICCRVESSGNRCRRRTLLTSASRWIASCDLCRVARVTPAISGQLAHDRAAANGLNGRVQNELPTH